MIAQTLFLIAMTALFMMGSIALLYTVSKGHKELLDSVRPAKSYSYYHTQEIKKMMQTSTEAAEGSKSTLRTRRTVMQAPKLGIA